MAALQGLSDRIVLETSTFTLGRAPGNQIVLNDGKVSSHHAVLQLLGEEYSITDLGSSNGTYINESRLQANIPTELKDGDKIRLGDTTYTYEGNRQDASGHEPTVIASKPSQSYQATMLASPPQPGSFEQNPSSNPGYNQSTPSPAYPQQNPPSNPGYNQGAPSPAYPQQNPPSNPGYNQGTPSSPSYPQYAPTVASSVPPTPVQQPAYPPQQAEQPYQQQAESYGQPGYPQSYQQQAESYGQPGYPQQTPGQSYQQPGQAYPQPGQYQQPERAPGQPYQQPGQAYPQPGQYQQPGQPGLPSQQPWGEVPQAFSQPTPPKRSGVKVLIIILVILLVLGAGGGGAAYFLTRPQPTINVTSSYTAGSTPAGASGTELNVSGQKFSGNSEITFLLDGNPVSGLATGHSDGNGALTTTLKVTDAWQVG
ncbi:MAG TPA: FHA domain-containing protein, partial [Ktedonobacteraceae bacterium]|nr:FHA domain-containing protein [Ktedonobacteraceae bacterium]